MLSSNADFLSVEEAAAVLDLTEGRIRQLLRATEMRGQKLGRYAWAIPRSEVERLKSSRDPNKPRRGRPRNR